MNMTEKQIAESVTSVLEHFGKLINSAQGTQQDSRKTIGVITIQFHDDGQNSFAFGGSFQKHGALGALLDVTLTLRENIHAQQAGAEIDAFVEMLNLSPNDVN